MDTDSSEIRLKEASVVLTKLNEQTLLQGSPQKCPASEVYNTAFSKSDYSPVVNIQEEPSSGQCIISQAKRKRKRKNTAPKRKLARTVDFYENIDDNSLSEAWNPCPLDTEHDVKSFSQDIDDTAYPYLHELTVQYVEGNNNAKISAIDQNFKNNQQNDDTRKLSATPIFVKKTKDQPSFVKELLPISKSDSQSGSKPIIHSAPNSTQHTPTPLSEGSKTGENFEKRKSERKVPNILSRTKKISAKSLKPKTTVSPVEIRPKSQERTSLTTATRKTFKETLSKQMVSPIKPNSSGLTFPVLQEAVYKETTLKCDRTESVDNHATCQPPKMLVDRSVKSDVYQHSDHHVNTSSFKPIIFSQSESYAREGPSEIKPTASKPHYSSRLRSKSGTKYIVRKDSIISANLSDLFDPVLNTRSTTDTGQRLILKLPDSCLNERKFYDNFVKKSDSPDMKNDRNIRASDSAQECSGLQNSPIPMESPKSVLSMGQTSPVLRLTQVQNDKKLSREEEPIRLYSQGGLDDVKREMNKMNPNTWKKLDKIPEIVTQSVPTAKRSSTEKTPTERFLANLQSRLMQGKNIPKKRSKLVEDQLINVKDARIVQTFSMSPQHGSGIYDDTTVNFNRDENETRVKCYGQVDTEIKEITDVNHVIKQEVKDDRTSNRMAMDITNAAVKQECVDVAYNMEGQHITGQHTDFKQECFNDNPTSTKNGHDNTRQYTGVKQENNTDLKKGKNVSGQCTGSKEKYDSENLNDFKINRDNIGQLDVKVELLDVIKIKKEPLDSYDYTEKRINVNVKTESVSVTEIKEGNNGLPETEIKQEKRFDDHAYTRTGKDNYSACNQHVSDDLHNIPVMVRELQEEKKTNNCTTPDKVQKSISQLAPIPVYAVRCGEKVVLFPASKAVNAGKVTSTEVVAHSTPVKTPEKVAPKSKEKSSKKKHTPYRPDKAQTDFAKKCQLSFSYEPKPKKSELDTDNLVTTDFNNIVNKRPKNHMKHMCAMVVQITRSEDNKFSFSRDILPLSFTNGSNPFLVRWHKDGIHVTMVTFNSKGKIQHLTVDSISPGFYCLSLKNEKGHRKNRTFEGLLTSTLPNEDLLCAEKDFLAIGEIKNIMDPTISKPDVRSFIGQTLTEALSDVLPIDLMQVYNPTISDRSYRPKVNDRCWYSADKFESFTKTYGRTRGFQPNGCRLPGEETS